MVASPSKSASSMTRGTRGFSSICKYIMCSCMSIRCLLSSSSLYIRYRYSNHIRTNPGKKCAPPLNIVAFTFIGLHACVASELSNRLGNIVSPRCILHFQYIFRLWIFEMSLQISLGVNFMHITFTQDL